jgi:hypothetical protein
MMQMKKMLKFGGRKRYNGEEGSEVGVDRPDDAAKDEGLESVLKGTKPSTPTTFKAAFAQARREGKDKFTFNGKSYTTELAKPKPAESKPSGRETAEENLSKRRPTDLASSKARHEGMKTAGERSQRESDAEKARESRLGSSILARDRLGNEPDAYIVNRRRRAAEEAAKETSTPSRTFGAGAMSAKGLGGMSGFAKGGKVGSASKRGDGIAQRGKTRGKMY